MNRRDLAVLTFRAIALWPIVTGLTQALEAVITWDVAYQQLVGAIPDTGAPATSSRAMLIMTTGAFLSRVAVGVVLWTFSGALARLAVGPDGGDVPVPDRRTLYLGAMFLAGVWLLASALPTAAYWLFWAIRTGWRPQEVEHGAQLAELAVRALVGGMLIRGSWLLPADLRNEHDPRGEALAKQADPAGRIADDDDSRGPRG